MQRVTPDRKLVALIMVYVTVFIDFIGVAILIPVQPFLVGIRPHKDAFSADSMDGLEPGAANSVIMASFIGAQFVSTLVFGPLSDRVGRRPMLLASLIGGALGYALQGLAIALGNFRFLLAARIFTGLLGGTRSVAVAYIADSVPPEKRAKLMGMLALAVTLAMQFGPLLGGSLGTISLPLPCYVAGGISFVGLCLVGLFVTESPKESKAMLANGNGQKSGDRIAFGLNIGFSFCCGFWTMAVIFIYALLMPAKFEYGPNEVGLAALGDGVMILVGNPIYLFLIKKIRVPLVAVIGCTLMSLTAFAPFFSDELPVFIFRYVAGLGGPMAVPAVSAIVSLIAPPQHRGAWTGITLAGQSLGRFVAPATLGVLFDADQRIPFCLAGGVALLGAFLSLGLAPRLPRPSKKQGDQAPSDKVAESSLTPETEARSRSPAMESEELSKQCETLLCKLRERRARLEMRKNTLEEGGTDPDFHEISADERATATFEISQWLVRLLESNGYQNWPAHMEGIKLMMFNSFPPVRKEPQVDKLTDIIAVLNRHIEVAEKSKLFDGAEDLFRALF